MDFFFKESLDLINFLRIWKNTNFLPQSILTPFLPKKFDRLFNQQFADQTTHISIQNLQVKLPGIPPGSRQVPMLMNFSEGQSSVPFFLIIFLLKQ